MVATTFSVSGSRAGLGSVALTQGNTANTYMVSDVGAATALPTLTASLTGISASAAIGTSSVEVDETLTGIAASCALGTLGISNTITLTGISSTSALGALDETVDVFFVLTGIAATPAVGTITDMVEVSITGIEATSAIADVSDEVDETLTGIEAICDVGTPICSTETNALIWTGVAAYPAVGIPLAVNLPIVTYVDLDSISATTGIGTLYPELGIELPSVSSRADVGIINPLVTASGMMFDELDAVTAVVPPSNIQVNLRWSDDRGASWAGSRSAQFGTMGAYATSLQFRRMGMARDRIFEVSWTAPIPTALIGTSIQVEVSAT